MIDECELPDAASCRLTIRSDASRANAAGSPERPAPADVAQRTVPAVASARSAAARATQPDRRLRVRLAPSPLIARHLPKRNAYLLLSRPSSGEKARAAPAPNPSNGYEGNALA